jgi:peroxiredoxin
MTPLLKKILFISILALFYTLFSCGKKFKDDNYVAYFGGEVTNPTNPYVLFCKDSEIIDTIPLKKDNTFFIKFDSLSPGLYSFKHEPEYQYIYFEKNDSLMVSINSKDFDQSIVFSGRGEEKNNFLMELYLKNEDDKSKLFGVLDYKINAFSKNIDSSYKAKEKFYLAKKEQIKWSDGFDLYAKATLDFYDYSKKEIYPMVHEMRTGEKIKQILPVGFYDFRKKIDFNNTKFINFSPFVKYLTHMLNNIASDKKTVTTCELDESYELNVRKLNIADTLFKSNAIKNTILNNIAFCYLLEDQNISNNKKFLDKYYSISSDKSQRNEIIKIGNAIQLLKIGNDLPETKLYDQNDNLVSISSLIKKKTVLFFWTENLDSHMVAAHKKILDLAKRHLDYQFIAINVDENQEKWKTLLSNYNFKNIKEYRAANFDDLKEKWVINKIHRTMIINSNHTINNAFVSLFDVNFEKQLN